MLKSFGRRFAIVAVLVVLMGLPLFLAGLMIDSRESYARQTAEGIGRDWGGVQLLSGPQLVVPVLRDVIIEEAKSTPGSTLPGKTRFEQQSTAPLVLNPETFDLSIAFTTEMRHRGPYDVPVYRASVRILSDFDTSVLEGQLRDDERALWEDAYLQLGLGDNRGLRGDTEVLADGQVLPLDPLTGGEGLRATTADPRGIAGYEIRMDLNGAERLSVVPVGRLSRVTMAGDWPHPGFVGNYLPDSREVTDSGFEASWQIPHLARALPQVSRNALVPHAARAMDFGVSFIDPADFYQKAQRITQYGMLFIALTFLTVLLTERGGARPTHPMQYVLIGLVQSVFALLMVSYAEYLGFGLAYLVAATATVLLLTAYAVWGLRLGRRGLVTGAVLTVIYAALYLILKSADFALLAGSTLVFFALAATMYATRDESWYQDKPDTPPAKDKTPKRRASPFGAPRPDQPEAAPDS